jgi:tetratricopeptide (TPR) repeat protein
MEELRQFDKIAPYLKDPLVLTGFGLLLIFALHRSLIKSGAILRMGGRASGVAVQTLLRHGFILAVLLIVLGFGWKFFESFRQSQAIEAAEKGLKDRLTAREADVQVLQTQLKELRGALQALPQQTEIPKARARIEQALTQAAQGKTDEAEAIFKEVEARRAAEGVTVNKEAAEAARYRGALALVRDPKAAVAAYHRAVELDPQNLNSWTILGGLQQITGNVSDAEAAFREVLARANVVQDRGAIAEAYSNLGWLHAMHGELDTRQLCFAISDFTVILSGPLPSSG